MNTWIVIICTCLVLLTDYRLSMKFKRAWIAILIASSLGVVILALLYVGFRHAEVKLFQFFMGIFGGLVVYLSIFIAREEPDEPPTEPLMRLSLVTVFLWVYIAVLLALCGEFTAIGTSAVFEIGTVLSMASACEINQILSKETLKSSLITSLFFGCAGAFLLLVTAKTTCQAILACWPG